MTNQILSKTTEIHSRLDFCLGLNCGSRELRFLDSTSLVALRQSRSIFTLLVFHESHKVITHQTYCIIWLHRYA